MDGIDCWVRSFRRPGVSLRRRSRGFGAELRNVQISL
jgi:hypothetical protein